MRTGAWPGILRVWLCGRDLFPAGFSPYPVFISPSSQSQISRKYSGLILPVSGSQTAPLTRLVLFMVCLSIAATFVAGTHYVLIDRPQAEFAAHPPSNSGGSCYPVEWWTALWRMLFGPGTCGVCYDSYNCCCD
jgi:hypothetical protein